MRDNLAHWNVNVDKHGQDVDYKGLARDIEQRSGEEADVAGTSQHVFQLEKNEVNAVERFVKHGVHLLNLEVVVDFGEHEKDAHEGPNQGEHLKFGQMLRRFFSLKFKAHFFQGISILTLL